MNNALAYFWRHPRRTGFIIFNLVVVAALVSWGAFTEQMRHEGVVGVPNLMLGYTGMAFLLAAWVVAWLAWAVMVLRRQAHLARLAAHSAAQARAGE